MSGPDGPGDPGSRSGPRSRPGRRALFSGPYDPGLATGPGADAGGDGDGHPTGGGPEAEPAGERSGPRPGRQAFFSEPAVDDGLGRGPGGEGGGGDVHPGLTTVVVECRTCRQRTPMSLVGLGLSLVPSLWLPARPWPRLMRCPACRRVSWCRIEWPSLRG